MARANPPVERLGIFLPNWIGDVVMATPTLRALRSRFPDAYLTGIMRPYVSDVLAGTTWLDANLHYDPRSSDDRLRGQAFRTALREAQLDTVVLLPNSLRTGYLAWASGARRRVGYLRAFRRWFLTDRLEHHRDGWTYLPTPVLDDYLRIAYHLGCPEQSRQVELATIPHDEQAATFALARLGIENDRPLIVFNSGGAFGAAKRWPDEYFARLARRVAEAHDVHVLVICGPSERDTADTIANEARHPRVHSLAGERLSIGLSKACVRRAALMVTTDSGPRHFAAAFDVPVVTLFGPTHVAWSENYQSSAVHLQRDVPCGPCQRRTCPLGHHRCMHELTVDDVYRAVYAKLERREVERAA